MIVPNTLHDFAGKEIRRTTVRHSTLREHDHAYVEFIAIRHFLVGRPTANGLVKQLKFESGTGVTIILNGQENHSPGVHPLHIPCYESTTQPSSSRLHLKVDQ